MHGWRSGQRRTGSRRINLRLVSRVSLRARRRTAPLEWRRPASTGHYGTFPQSNSTVLAWGLLPRGMMATKPDIELVALTKRFGDAVAVDNVSLRIPAGSYCCLLGPSGCGKTTTLRMIAGHEEATEGDIILGSENITNLPPASRGTAMMFQSYALFPHLDCTDNVAFSLRMRGVDKDTRRLACPRHAEARPDGAFRRPAAGPAFGWPAAARGAGARADHRPAGAAARRAVVGARSLPAHPHARGAEKPADATRHQFHPRHPQPGRGDGAGRPCGGDEPRQDRAGRHRARGLQQAGVGLRGALHRRPQRAAGGGRPGARRGGLRRHPRRSHERGRRARRGRSAPRRSPASRARSNISERPCRSASMWSGSKPCRPWCRRRASTPRRCGPASRWFCRGNPRTSMSSGIEVAS